MREQRKITKSEQTQLPTFHDLNGPLTFRRSFRLNKIDLPSPTADMSVYHGILGEVAAGWFVVLHC